MERRNFAALTIDKLNSRMSQDQKDMTVNNALESVNKGVNQIFDNVFDFTQGGVKSRYLSKTKNNFNGKGVFSNGFQGYWLGLLPDGTSWRSATSGDYLEYEFYSDYISVDALYFSGANYAVYLDDIFMFSCSDQVYDEYGVSSSQRSPMKLFEYQWNDYWKPIFGKHKVLIRKVDSLPGYIGGFNTSRKIAYSNLEIMNIMHAGVLNTSGSFKTSTGFRVNSVIDKYGCSDLSFSAFMDPFFTAARFLSLAGIRFSGTGEYTGMDEIEFSPSFICVPYQPVFGAGFGGIQEVFGLRYGTPYGYVGGGGGDIYYSVWVNVIAPQPLPLYVVDSIRISEFT